MTGPEHIAKIVSEALNGAFPGMGADIDRNLRGVVSGALRHLDLVSREELDVQEEMLARLRERVARLEARILELERR